VFCYGDDRFSQKETGCTGLTSQVLSFFLFFFLLFFSPPLWAVNRGLWSGGLRPPKSIIATYTVPCRSRHRVPAPVGGPPNGRRGDHRTPAVRRTEAAAKSAGETET